MRCGLIVILNEVKNLRSFVILNEVKNPPEGWGKANTLSLPGDPSAKPQDDNRLLRLLRALSRESPRHECYEKTKKIRADADASARTLGENDYPNNRMTTFALVHFTYRRLT